MLHVCTRSRFFLFQTTLFSQVIRVGWMFFFQKGAMLGQCFSAYVLTDVTHERVDPHALPSRHTTHHELGGHGILLGDRARVAPEHPAPPLVPPGIFCQVHDLVHLIFTLRVVLICCETRKAQVKVQYLK